MSLCWSPPSPACLPPLTMSLNKRLWNQSCSVVSVTLQKLGLHTPGCGFGSPQLSRTALGMFQEVPMFKSTSLVLNEPHARQNGINYGFLPELQASQCLLLLGCPLILQLSTCRKMENFCIKST